MNVKVIYNVIRRREEDKENEEAEKAKAEGCKVKIAIKNEYTNGSLDKP